MNTDKRNLRRPRYPMPDYVKLELEKRNLMKDYTARPDYQQNDYISWITRAKRPETREKRLKQMLDELQKGGIYMNMDHPPSRKS